MIDFGRKLLLVSLALATVAAQALCACPSGVQGETPVVEAKRSCRGEHECCVKDKPAAPTRSEAPADDPCEKCNLVHRSDQIQPDRQDAPAAAQVTLALAPLPLLAVPRIPDRFARSPLAEGVPIPLLLRDLYHSNTLLLN